MMSHSVLLIYKIGNFLSKQHLRIRLEFNKFEKSEQIPATELAAFFLELREGLAKEFAAFDEILFAPLVEFCNLHCKKKPRSFAYLIDWRKFIDQKFPQSSGDSKIIV